MRTAVITIVHGRPDHLRRQQAALDADLVDRVIVAMDDPDVVGASCSVERDHGTLPLARARNVGAQQALEHGAEVLVFLDVDCIPGPRLIARYEQEAVDGFLLCGPVGYLPPCADYPAGDLRHLVVPHPARPLPAEDAVVANDDPNLFWSLSFACTAATWTAVGGFCEDYRGYGGEDTDFAWTAFGKGVRSRWVGGAWAYHQHHSSETPPVGHLHDILRNAALFHARWGRWPMQGWLDAFAARGLATYAGGTWQAVEGATA